MSFSLIAMATPASKPSPTGTRHQSYALEFVYQFQSQPTLTRDDLLVVIRVNKDKPGLCERMFDGFQQSVPMLHSGRNFRVY
jgi:hypothetical protein